MAKRLKSSRKGNNYFLLTLIGGISFYNRVRDEIKRSAATLMFAFRALDLDHTAFHR